MLIIFRNTLLTLLVAFIASTACQAQQSGKGKMSPWLRQLARQEAHRQQQVRSSVRQQPDREVCAFVRISHEGDSVLQTYGSRSLTRIGNIHIATIPVDRLASLAQDPRVMRIEASPRGEICLDSLPQCINAHAAHQGARLPQAFTGDGVVVGLMDIGFDLTHPTFYDRSATHYRIRQLWDMLSTDTIDSPFYVGRDYRGTEALLALGHSRDGLDQSHGTMTAGVAAGSGYQSAYQGVAYDSDLCLVANATSNNSELIDTALYYRYTFATDALGFKYLFDYAKSVGKPCVVSFSEGSGQDFWGYDQLYYEMLDSLMGPGRILVSAAGNKGYQKTWLQKPSEKNSAGTFLRSWSGRQTCTLKSDGDFLIRAVTYGSPNDTLCISSRDVLLRPDSMLTDSIDNQNWLEIEAYPSCYVPQETCYDLTFHSDLHVGHERPLSLELIGTGAVIELWNGNGTLLGNSLNPDLNDSENTHNILSPASCPRVICVGSTNWRDSVLLLNGQWLSPWHNPTGLRAEFSSVGPTMDGRIKPDVMAPGNNIITSYSSFYLENHPDEGNTSWDVSHFDFLGRTYGWHADCGTSLSCPAVAGAIALWLQAKPDLTPEEVMEVIARTSRQPDPTLAYPNNEYGYGEIDTYRGLLYLLGIDGIQDISKQHTAAHIRPTAEGLLQVNLGQSVTQSVSLRLYNSSGRLVESITLPPRQVQHAVRLPRLPHGVYAVQVDGCPAVTGSTLIRL